MRKLSEEAKQRKAAYDADYIKKNIKQWTISFNLNDDEDMKIYHYIKGKPNGTRYIKNLVLEEKARSGE